MHYLFHAALLYRFGLYRYQPLTLEQAQNWLAQEPYVSAIHKEEMASELSRILGRAIKAQSDVKVHMHPEDQCLIVRPPPCCGRSPSGSASWPADTLLKERVSFGSQRCKTVTCLGD